MFKVETVAFEIGDFLGGVVCNLLNHFGNAIAIAGGQTDGGHAVRADKGTFVERDFLGGGQCVALLIEQVPRIGASVRGGKDAVHGVDGDVEKHDVEQLARAVGDDRVGGKVGEVDQGSHVFIVIAVGIPFRKTDAGPQVDPVEDARATFGHMLRTGQTRVWENALGEKLSGEVFGAVEEYLVIFRPEKHQVMAGLIHPVLEVEDGGVNGFEKRRCNKGMLPELVTQADQANKGKVGAIVTGIDVVECFADTRFINRSFVQFEAAELGQESRAAPTRF